MVIQATQATILELVGTKMPRDNSLFLLPPKFPLQSICLRRLFNSYRMKMLYMIKLTLHKKLILLVSVEAWLKILIINKIFSIKVWWKDRNRSRTFSRVMLFKCFLNNIKLTTNLEQLSKITKLWAVKPKLEV